MRKLRMNRSNCLLYKLKVATHCLAEELQGEKMCNWENCNQWMSYKSLAV